MKRKVIKLGANSLLVSLPSAWAKKHGITKGDEIVLEEKDNKLVLSSSKIPAGSTATIDITNLTPLVKRALGALYKKGYDEFTIHFADHDELERAYEVIREEFTGFEVVHHGKNHLVAREISQPHADQFDTVLRRQFLVIKDFANDIANALEGKDAAWLQRLTLRDKDVNKLADFCRRLINKHQSSQTSTGLYFIVEQLEKISDRYRDISSFASQQRLAPSKTLLKAYREVMEYLDEFYRCFYQFSLPAMNKFVERKQELIAAIEQFQDRASRDEQRVLFWLEDITEKLFDLNGPLMLLRL
jgi:phosphate uptake regulator